MPKFGFGGKGKGDVDVDIEGKTKAPKADGDVDVDGKVKVPKPKGDVDVDLDIKAPKMPKFEFGGKGKGEVDVDTKTKAPKGDIDVILMERLKCQNPKVMLILTLTLKHPKYLNLDLVEKEKMKQILTQVQRQNLPKVKFMLM